MYEFDIVTSIDLIRHQENTIETYYFVSTEAYDNNSTETSIIITEETSKQ